MPQLEVCTTENCHSSFFDEEGNCVLHSPKDEDFEHHSNFGKGGKENVEAFCYALSLYASIKIQESTESKNRTGTFDLENLRSHLHTGKNQSPIQLENIEVELKQIHFPIFSTTKNSAQNYTNIFRRIKNIHFNKCTFHKTLSCKNFSARFTNNQHLAEWITFTSSKSHPHAAKQPIYKNCHFSKQVTIGHSQIQDSYKCICIFESCTFNEELHIENYYSPILIFSSDKESKQDFKDLTIENSDIKNELSLENSSVRNVANFYQTTFENKVNLRNTTINTLQVKNSTATRDFDISHKAEVNCINIYNSHFEQLFSLEEATIGEPDPGRISRFSYATFNGYVSFRDSKFLNGLDIERINPSHSINFLRAEIHEKNTNRETFRIIKDSFDKQGNHIEANKFYALEMKKYQKEASFFDKIILHANLLISNHGQWWALPIVWLIILTGISAILLPNPENDLTSGTSNEATGFLNRFAEGFLPLKKIFIDGHEFVSLILAILFSILIWQTIVAVKRKTRR